MRATRPKHAKTRVGRLRDTSLGLAAAAVAVLTVLVSGPASAEVQPAPAAPISPAPQGPLAPTNAVAEFDSMIEEASERAADRAAALRRAERERARVEARQERIKKEKARERREAARIRASRASLRSAVMRPVAGGYRVTAQFGTGGSQWSSGRHTGLDFACATGTPVRAVARGVIVSSGYDGAYGNRVEIRHADGTVTTYSHLSSIVRASGSVGPGAVIGRVGTTGNTSGAHLHFEVLRGGALVDPGQWLRARYAAY